MSKQNRSGKSFRTLGQRMLSFGRGIMRTYASEQSSTPDTSDESTRPRGQWRSMTTNNLIWRQEQQATAAQQTDTDYGNYIEADDAEYDNVGNPIQRRPQQPRPRPQQGQQPVQRQPKPQQSNKPPPPNYVQTPDGSPIKVSRKQFSNPLQRKLDAIMEAHAEQDAQREQKREERIESLQRKVDQGELTTRRRRGSIDVDYVQTESLLPPEERGKPIQAKQDTTESNQPISDTKSDVDDDNQWFDSVPDDDEDIDNIADFDSADEDIQRLPDDLPRFDPSSLDEEDYPDDMGEFESGSDNFPSQSADPNSIIHRDMDDEFVADDDFASDNSVTDAPIQRTPQDAYDLPEFEGDFGSDETVPLIPNYQSSLPTPRTSIQRDDFDTADFDDADDFISDETPLSDDSPMQRNTIQRGELDDFDYDDADNYSSEENPLSGDSPVQRDMIQRDDFDEPDFDDIDNYPSEETPFAGDSSVQRNTIQREDFDTDDFDDIGDYSSDGTLISSDTPTQRDTIQRRELDDFDFDDADIFTSDDTPFSGDSPIQRDDFDEPDFDDIEDFTSDDALFSGDSPVQRNIIQPDDYDDADDFTSDETPFSSDSPIQRDTNDFDTADFDDIADFTSDDTPFSGDSPVQRDTEDFDDIEDYADFGDATWADLNDVAPASNDNPANTPIQRDDFDDTDFDPDYNPADFGDYSSVGDAPFANTPAQDTSHNQPIQRDDFDDIASSPVQRRAIQRDDIDYSADTDDNDYDDYGDATWAEMNDMTSAPHDAPANDVPVQRALDDTEPSDFYVTDDFDHLEDTDGMTAMNILGDYLADRGGDADSPLNAPPPTPVQRAYEEDGLTDYDAFNQAGSFDPTPHDDAPMDLFQAMSQAGMIKPSSQSPASQQPIQRDFPEDVDYQDDENNPDDYSDYGDATWAELNNYAPASSPSASSQTPIQRTPDDYSDQPMDLHQAMVNAGLVNPSNQSSATGDTPMQRTPSDGDEDAGLGQEAHDLYQAMMDAGMIQDSSGQSHMPSSSGEPIQREPQTDASQQSSPDMMDAFRKANQVSESSAVNRPDTEISSDQIARNIMQREGLDVPPIAISERASDASTELQKADDSSMQDDTEYLNQLARDVFRIIKQRLRLEKERRG